jgi:hypothetical protein
MALKQSPGEKVAAYLQRAEQMHDSLVLAGGKMSTTTFLQCLKEGVLEKYCLTVRLFELSTTQTTATLSGVLLSEECRLARQESLHGKSGSTTAAEVAMALQHINIPVEQVQDIVAALTSSKGSTQPWTARHASGSSAKPPTTIRSEERYAAAAKTSICWNCGVLGHRHQTCPQPAVTPLRFIPADYKPRVPFRTKRAAPPAVVA